MRTIFDVIARDNASGPLNKVNASMRNLGNSARGTEKAMGAGGGAKGGMFGPGAGGPIGKMLTGGAMVAAGDKMADFAINIAKGSRTMENAIGTMRAYGSTDADINRVKDAAFKSGFNIDRAAESLGQFAREGYNATQSAALLTPAMQLMKFGQMGAEESSKFLADTLDQFSLSAGRGQDVANKMAVAMKLFGVQGPELAEMFKGAASGAQLAGAGFEDVLLTTGMIKKVFPSATKAAMAAGQAFTQLADKKVRKELHAQGVDVLDSSKKFKPLTTILAELLSKTAKMTESQRASALASVFSKRSAGGLSVIMDQLANGVTDATGKLYKGADAATYLASQMANSEGAAAAMREAILNTTAGADEAFATSKTRLTETFSGATQGIYIKAMRLLAGVVNATADAMNSLPPIARQITVGFVGVTGIFMKTLGAVILLGGAMRMLGITFSGLLLTIGKTLLVAVPLLGLLGAIGVGFYGMHRAAEKNIGGTGGMFSGLWAKLKLGFKGTLDLISGGGISEAVKKELEKTENSGVAKFLVWVTGAIGRAKAFFGGMVAGFDAGLAKLDGPFSRFKSTLMGIFGFSETSDPKKQMEEWRKSGEKLGLGFADLSGKVIDFVNQGMKALQGAFKDISLKDVEGALKGILGLFNAMAKAAQWVADALQTVVDMKNAAFTIGKGTENLSSAEMLGITRGGGGLQARKNLALQFENVDKAVASGKYDRAFGQKVKQGLYTQMSGIATVKNLETLGGIADTLNSPGRGIVNAGLGFMGAGALKQGEPAPRNKAETFLEKQYQALLRVGDKIDKLADTGMSIRIGEDKVGEIVRGVSNGDSEKDYFEGFSGSSPAPAR